MSKKTDGRVEGLGNVDQIREIIFGSQLREFNQRFEKLQQAIDGLEQSMNARMQEQQQALQNDITNNTELLETKLKNLTALSTEEREAIREEVARNDKRVSVALQSLGEENDAKLQMVKKEMQTSSAHLKEEMEKLKKTLYIELEERLGTMEDAKVSRDSMAETLFEMAMKVKGEGVEIFLPEAEDE